MSVFDGAQAQWRSAERDSAEEIAAQEQLFGPFTDTVRSLIDATLLTDADPDDVTAAQALVEQATALLNRRRMPAPFGVKWGVDGTRRSWGNAAMGLRNPIAAPLQVFPEDGFVRAQANMGAAYEGPPGVVHGGMVALLLDQVLGAAAFYAGVPGMTGTLTIRYRAATRLGPVRLEARVARVEGVKTFVTGELSTDDGLCAEAEGVFVLPKQVRDFRAANPDLKL
ncbi:MAG TPA: PaaI family thioesterase [Gordonia sp. (in: high G+C Gram-positive bacteria)]|uniref:PaaI family thioesterase n=1 Tax=unclassified Gordonia (in: high G+C Gram-positive bacteria) TaxID=2657482 RepID=UPI000FC3314E|nr:MULTISPECIES: PaaI family thioesterase [unclassified Gordonia (in: high G+C Gram-positive bacteria)]RUP36606.1 MAG: PaaI family thioesterase [Gordonia sp. (in: high G+C Gram-positive bacteria)]HNP56015.1 PaaI family thioesterase [Gordonia sp. (in: high G+C Gram-positive bacteria)]HRC51912.1 PaaI family thioesterase [Gordonia sp. (in: high G+C Gram-positive bacteria)]